MSSVWKMAAIVSCSALCAIALKYMQKLFETEKNENNINNVLVYNAENEAKNDSTTDMNLSRITYLICNARSTVDVCMAKLTSSIVIDCLTVVAEKGVMVRIIIHSDCAAEELDCHDELLDAGAQRKIVNPKERLDYEIIIVDGLNVEVGDPVALVGALNYTFEDLCDQYDSTLITSELSIVNKLQEEFDRLWNSTEASI